MAGSVMSQTAALWQSSSRNLGLADWPLSGNRYSSFGSGVRVHRKKKLLFGKLFTLHDCPFINDAATGMEVQK